jgi:protein SCO1
LFAGAIGSVTVLSGAMKLKKAEIIRIVLMLIITIVGISGAYYFIKQNEKLPVINPSQVNPALVSEELRAKGRNHRIADFSLINQNGDTVTQNILDGKIYVADLFFTTCGSICPVMTTQMKRVYDEYADNDKVMFVSHTVMPEVDSANVLKEYAKKHNADIAQWIFLTGEKKQIYDLARKSYFAVATEGTGDEHDFIHTENFILIDTKKRIRGFYDGTSEKDVNRLIDEIGILLREKK